MGNGGGRVLPFARSAEQVRRMAARQQGHPLATLQLLRMSHERDREDAQTLLALADAYADMHCLRLAARAYFGLIKVEAYAGRAFFGLGQCYLDMGVYSLARDCLVMALQCQPDGDFAPDAVAMLDAVDQAEWTPGPAGRMLQARVGRVLDALTGGRVALAQRLVRRAVALGKNASGIRALEAFTHMAAGDRGAALAAAQAAYRADPKDARALCAMATVQAAHGKPRLARFFLQAASGRAMVDGELQVVLDTACELDAHDVLIRLLAQAEEISPYAADMLALHAQALHNAGQTDEALRRWRLLRSIDPMDMESAYLAEHAEAYTLPAVLPYGKRLPQRTLNKWMQTLAGWSRQDADTLVSRWREDTAMEALLRWGLRSDDLTGTGRLLGLLVMIGDERAKAVLRDVLCDLDAPTGLQYGALAALHMLGEPGPLYTVRGERLVAVAHGDEDADALQARHCRWIARLAMRRVTPQSHGEQESLARLCDAAAADPDLSTRLAARAVVQAFCMRHGRVSPLSSTHPKRRKAARVARRLYKEAYNAPGEL